MSMVLSQAVGPKFLEALGLPSERVIRVTVVMEVDQVVKIIPEYAASSDQFQAMQDALVEASK